MKKCPTCEKTFEDSLRFCQFDGTSLVDDEPAFDPYATIVARPNIPDAEESPSVEGSKSAEPGGTEVSDGDIASTEPEMHLTVGSVPIEPPDEVLDVPEADPLKTMYVSEAELRETFDPATEESSEQVAELGTDQPPMPEPPAFIEPELHGGSDSPPPSPFGVPGDLQGSVGAESTGPELSHTDLGFDDAATMIQAERPLISEPSPQNAEPVEEWTPPVAPVAEWGNAEIGQNTPFSPPPDGVRGQNKTLAIASLSIGILSVLCCSGFFVVGLAAIILGFIARSKASSNPTEYGGSGLALGGIIIGVISLVIGLLYWVLMLSGFLTIPNF